MNEETRLSPEEVRRRSELEMTIASGVRHFVAVGEALREMNASRLYRETHRTFEAYCAQRWSLSRRHVYRLMESAEAVRDVQDGLVRGENVPSGSKVSLENESLCPNGTQTPLPTNERQLRELAAAPREQRAEVWQASVAASGGVAPPAWRVKEILEKFKRGHAKVQELAAVVKEEEARVIDEGKATQERNQREDYESRVGRARWHLKRARRLIAAIGGDGERATEAILEADRILVEDAGDIPLRDS